MSYRPFLGQVLVELGQMTESASALGDTVAVSRKANSRYYEAQALRGQARVERPRDKWQRLWMRSTNPERFSPTWIAAWNSAGPWLSAANCTSRKGKMMLPERIGSKPWIYSDRLAPLSMRGILSNCLPKATNLT
jgi:hypothetical protein